MTPHLFLNRLIVVKRGHPLYDEKFHHGVNILHGDNGSGKSTIADFIFFALGGDLRQWKPHAGRADYVLAEVAIGDAVVTLRRDVSEDGARPMQIYFGEYEGAVSAGPMDWQAFSYKRPENGLSFSQVLFRAMGIPDAISDGASNITMHQLLRMLYVDQITPIQRLFRVENFDTWETRQAVGELLCGIGGYDLYDKQIQLRETRRAEETAAMQLRNLISVAAGYGEKILPENIKAATDNMTREREKLLERVSAIVAAEEVTKEEHTEEDALRKGIAREMRDVKKLVSTIEDRIETLEYEIADSTEFISHLDQALDEFNDAAAAFFSLGQIAFEYCPSCFSPTKEGVDIKHCHLCGSEVVAEESDSKALAVRLDIEMQLKESKALQEDREATLRALKSQLRVERIRYRKAASSYDLARRSAADGREVLLSELSRKIGFMDSELEVLQKRMELANEIERLSGIKEELNAKISGLRDAIEAIKGVQNKRKQIAYTAVSENAKRVLGQDLPEHNDFGEVNKISFSFSEDWVAINDDKNVSRSASGIVVLKNGFLLGMLISSLQDRQFLLPRFMLFDNIEDKGMVQERSWNFQRVLIKEVEASRSDYQVIFTTSKIAPELAGSPYVVGRKYTRDRPSLEFAVRDLQ